MSFLNCTPAVFVIGDEYEMNHYAQLEKKLGLCVYPKEIYNGKVSEIKM